MDFKWVMFKTLIRGIWVSLKNLENFRDDFMEVNIAYPFMKYEFQNRNIIFFKFKFSNIVFVTSIELSWFFSRILKVSDSQMFSSLFKIVNNAFVVLIVFKFSNFSCFFHKNSSYSSNNVFS